MTLAPRPESTRARWAPASILVAQGIRGPVTERRNPSWAERWRTRVAYALAIVVGRLIVLPETLLALFWPAAGVGALWALVTPRRRDLAFVAAMIWVLASAGLVVTGMPTDAAVVLGVANIVNSVGTAVAYSLADGQVVGGARGVAR